MLKQFIETVKNKNVFIATHWDADGVSSGAIIYHFIKRYSNITGLLSKGVVFRINDEDLNDNYDLVIVSDIMPGDLDKNKVIYIDHHPNEENYLIKIHDEKEQSTTLVLWKNLIYPAILNNEIKIEEIPYFVFLTLLGYFGDNGDEDNLPIDLYVIAKEALPNLMQWKEYYGRSILEIEKYISLLNIGKRKHWDGMLPLQMLVTSTRVEDIIFELNPLVKELNNMKSELRESYKLDVELIELKNLSIGIIESDYNIQGVLCARLMKDKPILIINKYMDYAIGSLRVPENVDFDAGEFLRKISKELDILEGGGHEKAAGITFWQKDLDLFLKKVKELDDSIEFF
ncbi:MAG: DHH family phosphoesterase [Candidatus Woesearchaeota archaeon]